MFSVAGGTVAGTRKSSDQIKLNVVYRQPPDRNGLRLLCVGFPFVVVVVAAPHAHTHTHTTD